MADDSGWPQQLSNSFIIGLRQDCSLRRNPDGRSTAKAVIELLCEELLAARSEIRRLSGHAFEDDDDG